MRQLSQLRVGWWTLAGIALLSAAATGLVVSAASTRTPAEQVALAALRHPRLIIRVHTPAPAARPAPVVRARSAGAAVSGPPPAPATSAPPTTAPAVPAPTTPIAASPDTTAKPAPVATVKVGHVFEIELSTPSFAAAFGNHSVARYLHRLTAGGTLLTGYRSLGAGQLADELAAVSGLAPDRATRAACPQYSACLLPDTDLTVGDQVTASGHVWKAYLDGMGPTSCAHPDSGAAAGVPISGAGAGYDVLRNPFVFFHSLLDLGDCQSDDEDLAKLAADLRRQASTARFSYLAPGACPTTAPVATTTTSTSTATTTTPATTPVPAAAGDCLAAEDAFLRTWVPRIERSAAYRHGAVLIIAFSRARTGRAGATGALVLSRHTAARRRVARRYSPYSLLRTVEDLLGLAPLAHAKHAASFAALVR